jgi:hypothetical protein
MAFSDSTIYPRIGGAGDRSYVLELYEVDSDLFTAPSGDATWTKYTDNATTAQELVCEDAGFLEILVDNVAGRIPYFTAT